MTRIDVSAESRPPTDPARPAPVVITVTVAGAVDDAAGQRLRELLSSLTATSCAVVVDVGAARCDHPRLIRVLCRTRSRRFADGLPFRLRGVHPGMLPPLDDIAMSELFVVYDEVRRDHAVRRAEDRRAALRRAAVPVADAAA